MVVPSPDTEILVATHQKFAIEQQMPKHIIYCSRQFVLRNLFAKQICFRGFIGVVIAYIPLMQLVCNDGKPERKLS